MSTGVGMVDRYATDPAMRATTFVVVDFEGTTPTGAPAEPIELGVVLLQLSAGRCRRRPA
ncbi:hypothetical protein AB0J72_34290 [Dactylosporangium sp. NPDC049742]|uniref:hypothetical protein n=1 Tax=Dactylosporangium sp. NPDC049742 TaxID=3154737 RepID=UPI00343A128C